MPEGLSQVFGAVARAGELLRVAAATDAQRSDPRRLACCRHGVTASMFFFFARCELAVCKTLGSVQDHDLGDTNCSSRRKTSARTCRVVD